MPSPLLQDVFTELVSRYTYDHRLIETSWNEIKDHYSEEQRHYHNLSHLENLYAQLVEIKPFISDWDTILFTLFYHDLIYDASSSENEEKSAEVAADRMGLLKIPIDKIRKCYAQILATKHHRFSNDMDTNFFTDADLSILGQDWQTYHPYAKNIRLEYSNYPDELYNPGRLNVLKHFMKMESIFKTTHFQGKFEMRARRNLQQELNDLTQS